MSFFSRVKGQSFVDCFLTHLVKYNQEMLCLYSVAIIPADEMASAQSTLRSLWVVSVYHVNSWEDTHFAGSPGTVTAELTSMNKIMGRWDDRSNDFRFICKLTLGNDWVTEFKPWCSTRTDSGEKMGLSAWRLWSSLNSSQDVRNPKVKCGSLSGKTLGNYTPYIQVDFHQRFKIRGVELSSIACCCSRLPSNVYSSVMHARVVGFQVKMSMLCLHVRKKFTQIDVLFC